MGRLEKSPLISYAEVVTVVMDHLSVCSFQVRVCCAASPWCCWCRCWGWRRCCCSCCTSTQQGGTVAEKRGVSVSKRVSSTSDVNVSTPRVWSTRRSTPGKWAGKHERGHLKRKARTSRHSDGADGPLTCDPRTRRIRGWLCPFRQLLYPFTKGTINKDVTVINIITYTSNLKEMQLSTLN